MSNTLHVLTCSLAQLLYTRHPRQLVETSSPIMNFLLCVSDEHQTTNVIANCCIPSLLSGPSRMFLGLQAILCWTQKILWEGKLLLVKKKRVTETRCPGD